MHEPNMLVVSQSLSYSRPHHYEVSDRGWVMNNILPPLQLHPLHILGLGARKMLGAPGLTIRNKEATNEV